MASSARAKVRDSYFALVKQFPLRPIQSESELDRAIDMVNSLIDRASDLDADEAAYLDVLSDLVKKYEDQTSPLANKFSDGEILAYLLESKAITQTDLAAQTGIVQSTLSSVLAGKRKLTREHISKLSSYFRISPTTFS